jgi:hypothetical protein
MEREINFLVLGEQIPETRYVYEPIVPEGTFVFFVGAEGSAKTIVARHVALKAALAGRSVVYFSEDNPRVKDEQYLARMLAGMGQDSTHLPESLKYSHSQGVNLADPADLEGVLGIVVSERPDLLIVDGYTTMFGGGMAQRDYESWDTGSVYSTLLKRLRSVCDLSVITICHGPNSAPTRLPGGSSLRGVADLTIAFEAADSGFRLWNQKTSRYPFFERRGAVVGDWDESPLQVRIGDEVEIKFLRETGIKIEPVKPPKHEGGRPRDPDPSKQALYMREYRERRKRGR